MKTIELECARCKSKFDKSIYEHRRRIKHGATRFFCNTSCTAKTGNDERPEGKGKTKLSWSERLEKYPRIRTASLVSRIRQRAKKKNVPCEITNKMYWEMVEKQNHKCAYSGERMVMDGTFSQNSATVDRIKPELGYIKDNMVLCCRWANMAKGSGSQKDLVERAKQLILYLR